MSAIIAEEPPPIEQRIPAPLRWIIDRCLAKDPADRYESSRDLFQSLRSLRDHAIGAAACSGRPRWPQSARPPSARRRHLPWPLAVGVRAGIVATIAIYCCARGPAMPDQSAYRFTPFSFAPGGQYGALWSPDGKAVAYAARDSRARIQTYIRYLDAATPVQNHAHRRRRRPHWPGLPMASACC